MQQDSGLDGEHPLVLELKSLQSEVARFQREAHSASVKLQRHSLDGFHSLERLQFLERENARLRDENALLRAHPDITPHPATFQVQELTIALRRASDKTDLIEQTLLSRTTELAIALSEVVKGKHDLEAAYELAARTRGREEEGKLRERELEWKLKAAEEERKMMDSVVNDYAVLVRSLEGRQHPTTAPSLEALEISRNATTYSTTLLDGLAEGKAGLHKLLAEFNGEIEGLRAEIDRLHGELATVDAHRAAIQKSAEQDRISIAKARAQLDKLNIDDRTAAKVVSRYMKFSQSSTDNLQKTMENMKARHAATIASQQAQVEFFQKSLVSEQHQSDRLRRALDELSEDILRESYGRRREVSLRLALLSREELLAEGTRRWYRKAVERLDRATTTGEDALASLTRVVQDGHHILVLLDGKSAEPQPLGSAARVSAAQNAVSTLIDELQTESSKRIALARKVARSVVHDDKTAESTHTLGAHQNCSATNALLPKHNSSAPILSVDMSHTPNDITPNGSSIYSHGSAGPIITDIAAEATDTPMTRETESPSTKAPPPPGPEPVVVDDRLSPPHSVSTQNGTLSGEQIYALPLSSARTEVEEIVASSITFPIDSTSPIGSGYVESEDTQQGVSQDHSLLPDLVRVRHRYDELQRSFRDCYLALKELKAGLASSLLSPGTATSFHRVVDRLNDFNEDTRVELEIRIGDEELVARGYETLLCVPGAISGGEEQNQIEYEIRSFINGTSKNVVKATQSFMRKLGDVEHDIAIIKRSLHELRLAEPHRLSDTDNSSAWSFWGSGLLRDPPRPASPAPTFGSVMTTPHLRHSPSQKHLSDASGEEDPLAGLGLRVSAPSIAPVALPPTYFGISPQRPNARARTTSAVHSLGLGYRTTSLVGHNTPQIASRGLPSDDELGADSGAEDNAETDVE